MAAHSLFSLRTLTTIIVAGALATASFDLIGKVIGPAVQFSTLAPTGLAGAVWGAAGLEALTGIGGRPGSWLLHLLAGLVIYPLGYVLVFRPIFRFLPWIILSTLYGLVLYGFAFFIVRDLYLGQNFSYTDNLSILAIIGHVVFAWIVGFVTWRRSN